MNTNPYAEKLAQFLEDEVMYQAVRRILETQFDLNVQVKDVVSDFQLAEIVRGCIDGRERLKSGFKELEKFRRSDATPKEKEANPAV